jgi:hypothetical protein
MEEHASMLRHMPGAALKGKLRIEQQDREPIFGRGPARPLGN